MPAPQPIYQPDLTINQTYPGNHYTIESTGSPIALPKSTKVTEGFGFNVIADLFQPLGYSRAYAVGPKNKEVRPYRFTSTFIVANPSVMESTAATIRQALETATYIVRNGWYLTVELIKTSSPEMTSYTSFNLSFTVYPRFAMWTAARVQTESEYLTTAKRDFVVFDGYIPPPPVPVVVPIVWQTPQLLPEAPIGEYYETTVFAVGGNGLLTYSRVAGYADISVSVNGVVEWPLPDRSSATIAIRASDNQGQVLNRTFTINADGNFYRNGAFAILNGPNILSY